MNTLLNHRSQVPCYAYFKIFIFHSSAIGLDNDSSKSPVFAASRYNFDLSEADVLLPTCLEGATNKGDGWKDGLS